MIFAPQEVDQLIPNDFYELLLGGKTLQNLLAQGFCFDRFKKAFDDPDMNISLKKRQAYFPESVIDVFFCNLSLTPKFFEGQLEFVG